MESKRIVRVVLCAVLAVTLSSLTGCGASGGGDADTVPSEESSGSGGGGTLTVFAASSLTDAFGELGGDFTEETGAEVTFNFTSSSTLATQIEQGAPADVFASADEAQMENVEEAGLVSSTPEVFARNREVVIVPAGNPGGIEDFGDLAKPGLRLVLAQEDVPAAEYAEEILANAAEDPQYGESFEDDVKGNIVSREEDVRASVNRVVVGDADATFGYASDVTPEIRDEVEVVEIPGDLQVTAEYPVAVLSDSEDPDLAREWVELVTGAEGQRVLEEWGFEPAG